MSNPDDRSPNPTPSPSLRAEANQISNFRHGTIVYQLEDPEDLLRTHREAQLEAYIILEPILDALKSALQAAADPFSLSSRTCLADLLSMMLPEREDTYQPNQERG